MHPVRIRKSCDLIDVILMIPPSCAMPIPYNPDCILSSVSQHIYIQLSPVRSAASCTSLMPGGASPVVYVCGSRTRSQAPGDKIRYEIVGLVKLIVETNAAIEEVQRRVGSVHCRYLHHVPGIGRPCSRNICLFMRAYAHAAQH